VRELVTILGWRSLNSHLVHFQRHVDHMQRYEPSGLKSPRENWDCALYRSLLGEVYLNLRCRLKAALQKCLNLVVTQGGTPSLRPSMSRRWFDSSHHKSATHKAHLDEQILIKF